MVYNSIRAATRYNNWRPRDERDVGIITTQIIHRFSLRYLEPKGIPDRSLTVDEIAYFFREPERGTMGLFPYHFVLELSGTVHQCLPLSVIGLAAGNFNRNSVQLALIGDFRKEQPSTPQMVSLMKLCKDLYRFGITGINGHTDKPGGTAEADKRCPGSQLVVPAFRMDLKEQLANESKSALTCQGVKL